MLQSLGARRGQLDQREGDLDTQVQLIAAAETKLDGRIAQMNALKGDIQGLLTQADSAQAAETDRLVRVYEAMKPKDAAGRITLMDDSVRLPMAAKMKERALAAILSQMPPEDAKALTEKLAHRVGSPVRTPPHRARPTPADRAEPAGRATQPRKPPPDQADQADADASPAKPRGRHRRQAQAASRQAGEARPAAPTPTAQASAGHARRRLRPTAAPAAKAG